VEVAAKPYLNLNHFLVARHNVYRKSVFLSSLPNAAGTELGEGAVQAAALVGDDEAVEQLAAVALGRALVDLHHGGTRKIVIPWRCLWAARPKFRIHVR
jgi:hypothetical protein